MTPDFNIYLNDSLPELVVTCAPPAGTSPDFTGATVQFDFRPLGSSTPNLLAAVLLDATSRSVQHTWLPGEVSAPGLYSGRFIVTLAGGSVETYPNTTPILIRVWP